MLIEIIAATEHEGRDGLARAVAIQPADPLLDTVGSHWQVVMDNRLGAALEIEPIFVCSITHKHTAAWLLQKSCEDLFLTFGRGSNDAVIEFSLEEGRHTVCG